MGKEWDTFEPSHIKKHHKPNRKKLVYKYDFKDGVKVYRKKPEWVRKEARSDIAGQYDISLEGRLRFQKWFTRWAKECLRVAKPGAFMLVFGGTRTFHRLTCAIEDAGWQIRDCLMWLYGSGFPKSKDIGKEFDKQKCRKRLAKKLDREPTKKEFKKVWEKFRKVVGKTTLPDRANGKGKWNPKVKGSGFQNEKYWGQTNITVPVTKLAKLWNGYGTGLKPSWEPIIVAMKPVNGNFAKNAEKWGVSGLNIDGGRIGTGDNTHRVIKVPRFKDKYAGGKGYDGRGENGNWEGGRNPQGRWPANVILDEEAAKLLDKQSGNVETGSWCRTNKMRPFDNKGKPIDYIQGQKISESPHGASRFFYIAKASRGERNAGCGGMKKQRIDIAGQNSPEGRAKRGRNPNGIMPVANFHPTVKPLSLMQYLCMLLKMPNKDQIILDPFVGSGTTCVACKELGINYIGIDKDKDYCEIARARLRNVRPNIFAEDKPKRKAKKKKTKESFRIFK